MLLFVGSCSTFLPGLSLSTRSPLLMATLPIVAAAALTLDLDTSRTGFVRIEQQSMYRVQERINAIAPSLPNAQ